MHFQNDARYQPVQSQVVMADGLIFYPAEGIPTDFTCLPAKSPEVIAEGHDKVSRKYIGAVILNIIV